MQNDLILEGKKFISSRRAAQFCGYTQDYIGQLIRGRKVDAWMVGRSWFVSEESLISYKAQVEEIQKQKSLSEGVSKQDVSLVERIENSPLVNQSPDVIAASSAIEEKPKLFSDERPFAERVRAQEISPELELYTKNSLVKKIAELPLENKSSTPFLTFTTLGKKALVSALSLSLVIGGLWAIESGREKMIAVEMDQSSLAAIVTASTDASYGALEMIALGTYETFYPLFNRVGNALAHLFSDDAPDTLAIVSTDDASRELPKTTTTTGDTQVLDSIATLRAEMNTSFSKVFDGISSILGQSYRSSGSGETIVTSVPVSSGVTSLEMTSQLASVYSILQSQINRLVGTTTVTTQNVRNARDANVTAKIVGSDISDSDITGSTFSGTSVRTDLLTVSGTGTTTILGTSLFDTDSLVIDAVNHRIGVGTTSPYEKLSVSGNVVAEAIFGTSANATSTFLGGLTLGTSGLVYQEATKNIGIGTTSPLATLDILQSANGTPIISAYRVTDTAPTGDFINYRSRAGTTLFRVDNSGNLLAGGIINTGSQTVTSLIGPQFRVQYDGSNEITTTVSSSGTTTLAVSGTTPSLVFTPQANRVTSFQFTDASAIPVLSIDTQNQRVGVGTTSPWGELSVNPNGIAGPAFVVGSSTKTDFMVTNGGNVAIGTSTSSFGSNGGRLVIDDTKDGQSVVRLLNLSDSTNSYAEFNVRAGSVNAYLGATPLNSSVTTGAASAGRGYVWNSGTGNLGLDIVAASPNTDLRFYAGGSSASNERMRITSTGSVGIGTTSPLARLAISNFNGGSTPLFFVASSTGSGATTTNFIVDAYGSVGINTTSRTLNTVDFGGGVFAVSGRNTNTNGNIQIIGNNLVNATGVVGRLAFTDNTAETYTNVAFIQVNKGGTSDSGEFIFQTKPAGGALAERMRITSTGNVGISTTSPFARLSVAGDAYIGGNLTATGTATVISSAGNQLRLAYDTSRYVDTTVSSQGLVTFQNNSSVLSGGASMFTFRSTAGPALGGYTIANFADENGVSKATISNLGVISSAAGSFSGSNNGVTELRSGLGGTSGGPALVLNGGASHGIAVQVQDGGSTFVTFRGADTTTGPAGAVGIGTTSPFAKLSVAGDAYIGGNLTATGTASLGTTTMTSLVVTNTSTSTFAGNVGFGTAAYSNIPGIDKISVMGGAISFLRTSSPDWGPVVGFDYDATTDALRFRANVGSNGLNNTYMSMNRTTGNVGIGTTTPWGKLSVANTGSTPSFIVEDSTSPDSTPFVVDASGNVGIGTTTPSSKLEIGDNTVTNKLTVTSNNISSIIFNDQGGSPRVWEVGTNGNKFLIQDTTSAVTPFTIEENAVSNMLYLDNSGNVGIGTTTPVNTLTVDGVAPVFGVYASTNSRGITIDPATYGITSINSTLNLNRFNSNNVAAVTGGGNFGVGTGTPFAKLSVAGDVYIGGNLTATGTLAVSGATSFGTTTVTNLIVTNTSTSTFAGSIDVNNVGTNSTSTFASNLWVKGTLRTGTGSLYLNDTSLTAGNGGFQLNTTGNSYVNAVSGNFGIATTVPTYRFSIGSPGSATSGVVSDGDNIWYTYQGDQRFNLSSNGTAALGLPSGHDGGALSFASGNARSVISGGGSGQANLRFFTGNDVTTAKMSILSGGNVGIGTTTPNDKLSIVANASAAALVTLQNTASGGYGGFNIYDHNYVPAAAISYANSSAGILPDSFFVGPRNNTASLHLVTTSGLTPRLTITTGGNVGIGTTTPSHKLDIFSNSDTKLQIQGTGNDFIKLDRTAVNSWYIGNNSGGLAFDTSSIASGGSKLFVSSAGNVGIGTTTPSNKLVVFNASSASTAQIMGGGAGTTQSILRLTSVTNEDRARGIMYDKVTGGTPWYSGMVYGSDGYTIGRNASSPETLANSLFYIHNSGSVGIGTSSPSSKLHIEGAGGATLSIQRNDSAQGNGVVAFKGSDGSIDSSISYNNLVAGALTFETDGSNTRMTISSAGNVGIGTTSPMARLQVDRNGGSGDVMVLGDGIYRMGALGIESATNTFYVGNPYGSSNLQFRTSGTTTATTRMTIDSTGNVGIGTTSPQQELSLSSNNVTGINIDSTLATAEGRIQFTFDGGATNAGLLNVQEGVSMLLGTQASLPLAFQTLGSERMRIGASGNVGIGTTSPRGRLDIQDSTDATLYTYRPGSSTFGLVAVDSNNSAINRTDTAFQFRFNTGSSLGSATEKMRITDTGTVGIGTTTPTATMSVRGGAGTYIADFGGGSAANPAIRLLDSSTFVSVIGINQNNTTYNDIDFRSGNTSQLRISTNGNVGIGTTSPFAKLSVAGDAYIGGNLTATGTASVADTLTLLNNTINANSNALIIQRAGGTANASILLMDTTASAGGRIGTAGSNSIQFLSHNGGTEYARFTSAGNLGIGTTTPGSTLTLDGASSGRGAIYLNTSSGNVSSISLGRSDSSWRIANETDFRIYQGGGYQSSPTTLMALSILNTSGNVGIGTTSPFAKLSVAGDTYIGGNLTATGTAVLNNMSVINTGGSNYRITGAGAMSIDSATLIMFRNQSGSSEWARFDSAGNLGIGTSSPYSKLSVVGQVVAQNFVATSTSATSTIAGGLDVGGGAMRYDFSSGVTTIDNLEIGNTFFESDAGIITWADLPVTSASANGVVNSYSASINGNPLLTLYSTSDGAGNALNQNVGIGSSTPWGKLAINPVAGDVNQFVVGSSTRTSFVINPAGNVGIGTTTPATKLHIGGSSEVLRVGDGVGDVTIGAQTTAGASTIFNIQNVNSRNKLSIGSATGGDIALQTVFGVSLTVANTTGNIGIGTTTPRDLLEVGGNNTGAVLIGINSGVREIYQGETTSRWQLSRDALGGGVAGLTFSGATGGAAVGLPANRTLGFYTSNGTALTERMRIDLSGNVGIGTTTPQSQLSVIGASGLSVSSGVGNGTVGTLQLLPGTGSPVSGRLQFGTDGTGWQFRIAQNQAGVITDLVSVVTGGNVGIGTTTPATKLDVDGGTNLGKAKFDVSTVEGTLKLYRWSGVTGLFQGVGIAAAQTVSGTPLLKFQTSSAAGSPGAETLTDRMVIDSNGNVGIGTTTPAHRLSVVGDGIWLDNNTSDNGLYFTTAGGTARMQLFRAAGQNDVRMRSSNGGLANSGDIMTWDYDAGNVGVATNTPWGLFSINPDVAHGSAPSFVIGSSTATRFVVNNAGQVGIGTAAPITALHVAAVAPTIRLEDTNTTIKHNINGAGGVFSLTADTGNGAAGSRAITFNLFNTEYARLGSTGNLGVGTTTPWAQLSVNPNGLTGPSFAIGSSTKTDFIVTNAGSVGIGTTSPQRLLHVYRSSDGPPVRFEDSNGYCEIDPTSTSWTCTSDRNLKKDITDLTSEDTLSRIALLNAVSFHWNKDTDSDALRYGFIAQDVEEVFPELVLTADNGLKSVMYGGFTPFIIEAIKELDLSLASLNDRVTTLDVVVTDLASSLASTTSALASTTAELTARLDATASLVASLLAQASSTVSTTPVETTQTIVWSSDIGTQMLSFLESVGLTIENGIAYVQGIVSDVVTTKKLTVGDSANLAGAGVTILDRATGQPACVYIENSIVRSEGGACGALPTATSDGSPTAPVVITDQAPTPVVDETATTTLPVIVDDGSTASSTDSGVPAPEPVVEPVPESVPETAPESAPETVVSTETEPVTTP